MSRREAFIIRSLIKAFSPNPHERKQLDYLVFSLGLLRDQLNPRKPHFLDIPRWKHWESVPAFGQEMLPPLYLAFIQWPIRAFQKDGKDNTQMFELFNGESR